jgi:hypothetical protein
MCLEIPGKLAGTLREHDLPGGFIDLTPLAPDFLKTFKPQSPLNAKIFAMSERIGDCSCSIIPRRD